MSQRALERLKTRLGPKILETSSFRGDERAVVAPADWTEAARVLRDDTELAMEHFVDLTAVDYPDREPRFDVVLSVRSNARNQRMRLVARVKDGEEIDSVVPVWAGAGWAERETWDMFGIRFRGHPDLRRILMYEEFEGHALRKDYPIERTQPLVPYRDAEGIEKLPPFGREEGQPWQRVDWHARLAKQSLQVSPAIAVQTGEKVALSSGTDKLPADRIHLDGDE